MSTPNFARILVAVDRSERAKQVFETADAIARATGASLIALHAVGLSDALPRDALAVPPERVLEEIVEAAEASMRALVGDRPIRILVESGTAVDVILHVATRESVDLIVVGAHGYRFAERVLGTTAARIVDRASQSVMVVR